MKEDPFSQWRSDRLSREAMARRILGVKWDAGRSDIRKVFRKLALEHHPDRNPGSPEAEEFFININNAYLTLCKGKNVPLADPGAFRRRARCGNETILDYFAWWRKKFVS